MGRGGEMAVLVNLASNHEYVLYITCTPHLMAFLPENEIPTLFSFPWGGDRMKNGNNENQRQASGDGSNAPEIV